jgi:hypothetical protein
LSFPLADIAICCGTACGYFIEDFGQLLGGEERKLFAELQLLVIGNVLVFIVEETSRALRLRFLNWLYV